MTRIISALLLALVASFCSAQEAAPVTLADNAPERHIVVPGDTLWGISAKFLKEPWRWPEVWRMNRDQIRNPHRIYPGDVIVLDRDANGNPQLRLAGEGKLSPKVYSETISTAIPTIAASVIEPFLSQPLVVNDITVNNGARIIGMSEDRVYVSPGDTAYVTGAGNMPDQKLWQIFRPGQPIPDPETKEVLGYEAFFLGTAEQTRPGDPATFEIRTFKQEIGRGDRLLPAPQPPLLNYVPHTPEHKIAGRIASVYGGVGEGGRTSIVTINKGSRDGLEFGHVLVIMRNREETFRNSETGEKETYRLPPERTGLIFVFRTFERISYALVLQATGTLSTNDIIESP